MHSVGQVIRGGEPLMQIVPSQDQLVIDAHFAAVDIDRVHRASKVEYGSLHSIRAPHR